MASHGFERYKSENADTWEWSNERASTEKEKENRERQWHHGNKENGETNEYTHKLRDDNLPMIDPKPKNVKSNKERTARNFPTPSVRAA